MRSQVQVRAILAGVIALALAACASEPGRGASSGPMERRDYWCDDGRRLLGRFGPETASVNLDHFGMIALSAVPDPADPQRPRAYRSDSFAGGPLIATRTGDTLRLVSPGWPDTVCRP